MTKAEQFQHILDLVFQRLEDEPWFSQAENYVIQVNESDKPRDGQKIVLATTTRGGHMPTRITYYLQNIYSLTFKEIYRITKHEFAHLWGLHEKDAQQVE